jgi:predicted DNA-binding transcriptional regulator YafY
MQAKPSKAAGDARRPAKAAAHAREAKVAVAPPPKPAYSVTYNTGIRMLEVAFLFLSPPSSWTVDEVAERLEVDTRTVGRYLLALRSMIFNGNLHPAVLRLEDRQGNEIVIDDDDPVQKIPETRVARGRLTDPEGDGASDSPPGNLVPLFLAFTVLRFLEGIIPKEDVVTIWEDLARRVAPSESSWVADFQRKFFSMHYTPKSYVGDENLPKIVDALIRQHVLAVRYYGVDGGGKDHRLEPYTLAMYREGLYLIGRTDRGDHVTRLAVERIDSAEPLLDESGEPVTFTYPAGYSPDTHFEGQFGLMDGDQVDVEIEIQNAETDARLSDRRIHPTQKIVGRTPRRGRPYEKRVLQMKVRGTRELKNWVLTWTPYVRVVKPEALRAEVHAALAEGMRLHEGSESSASR